jgi:hypothetical protein
MTFRSGIGRVFVAILAGVSAASARAGELTVVSVAPALNGLNAPTSAAVSVTFDRPVNPATVTSASFRVFGRWSGAAEGKFILSNGNQTVTLDPINPFSAGENVLVNLSHDLAAADGSPMRPGGYSWRFWVRTRLGCWILPQIDQFSNRPTPTTQTRIYGALGSDLNNDGWLDITTVNEVSADLRVCLNTADGSGLFEDFLPPAEGLFEMSPNEPADFNNDGFTDVAVASSATDNVLIFLGNGDGSFDTPQVIPVADQPLGICVADVDGDGDCDVVNTNYGGAGNLSLLLNNGNGVFGAASFFEGGGSGEYGIASGDFNRDGLLDLAVGSRSSGRVTLQYGNGAGGFTMGPQVNNVGATWQLGTGDVNGDGWEDVNVACSSSNTGAILLNNGAGGLNAATTYAVPAQAIATDLADFDGDGDLDWTISSFSGGQWTLFENDGAGDFTENQQFDATSNPACSTSMDLNNDRRIDLVLLDEIADLVTLRLNAVLTADTNCDGNVNADDLTNVILNWGPCGSTPPCAADVSPPAGNDVVDADDLVEVILNWG